MLPLSNKHEQKKKSTEEEKHDDKKCVIQTAGSESKTFSMKKESFLSQKGSNRPQTFFFFLYFEKLSGIKSMQMTCY